MNTKGKPDEDAPRLTVGQARHLDCALHLVYCRSFTGADMPAVLWRRADTGEAIAAGHEDDRGASAEV